MRACQTLVQGKWHVLFTLGIECNKIIMCYTIKHILLQKICIGNLWEKSVGFFKNRISIEFLFAFTAIAILLTFTNT